MASTDLFQQRADECRRLAAAARSANDKVFWLGLVERWRAVESRNARRPCLRPGPLPGDLQKRSPGGEMRQPRLAQSARNDGSSREKG